MDYLLVHKWDRYSRNIGEAYQYIDMFKGFGVEVNSIQEWIDYDVPQQYLMLAVYLGVGEVENRVKSERTMMGIHAALKSGRYINKQPYGFVKGRDGRGRPLMQPDAILAPLVIELLHDFSMGVYTQQELIVKYNDKGAKIDKNGLARIIRNPLYAGLVKVPAYKSEPETMVKGLHKALISEEVFWKNQDVLANRDRNIRKPKVLTQELALRGFLTCPKCGKSMTGSASRSKTGTRHFYYHCHGKSKCGNRVKAETLNNGVIELLSEIKPSPETVELFSEILKDASGLNQSERKKKTDRVRKEIKTVNKKQDSLLDKYVSDHIDGAVYEQAKKRYDKELYQLSSELKNTAIDDSEELAMLEKCGDFLLHLDTAYQTGSVEVKQKIQSSILKEKLVFEDGKYRTPVLHEVIGLICKTGKGCRGLRKEKGRTYEKSSLNVARRGLTTCQ